jgi:hypothetical protein
MRDIGIGAGFHAHTDLVRRYYKRIRYSERNPRSYRGCYSEQSPLSSGPRLVTLHNPWGEITASGAPKARHGSFTMPWDMMMRFFSILSTVGERR